jgi:hypothetical protein
VFNATFNNISVLLVEETGVPGKTTELSQRKLKTTYDRVNIIIHGLNNYAVT